MRRDTLAMIWIGGLVLAAALYFIGPDRFLDACLGLFDGIDVAIHNLAIMLGTQAHGVVRALAIALYVVFLVLSLLAAQRGHRAIGALTVVTIVFLVLVWRPYVGLPAPLSRWIVALVLVVVAGAVMTQRLLAPVGRRGGPWPPVSPGRPTP